MDTSGDSKGGLGPRAVLIGRVYRNPNLWHPLVLHPRLVTLRSMMIWDVGQSARVLMALPSLCPLVYILSFLPRLWLWKFNYLAIYKKEGGPL